MALSVQPPFQIEHFIRIIAVQWGGKIMFVEINTGVTQQIRIRVEDPAGPPNDVFFRGTDPVYTEENPPPLYPDGDEDDAVISRKDWADYRLINAEAGHTVGELPGGIIIGWADVPYAPFDDHAGSLVGFFDPCMNKNNGDYIGDEGCNAAIQRGGITIDGVFHEIITGGISNHTYIVDKKAEYSLGGFKRLHYSHQMPEPTLDRRETFIDDRRDYDPEIDTNITEAQWNAGLLLPYDFSLFKAENAITGSPGFGIDKMFWPGFVNFVFNKPKDGYPRAKVIVAELEEPTPGFIMPNSSIRLRVWSAAKFDVKDIVGGEGKMITYAGNSSPKLDVTKSPLVHGEDGILARFNAEGFIE